MPTSKEKSERGLPAGERAKLLRIIERISQESPVQLELLKVFYFGDRDAQETLIREALGGRVPTERQQEAIDAYYELRGKFTASQ